MSRKQERKKNSNCVICRNEFKNCRKKIDYLEKKKYANGAPDLQTPTTKYQNIIIKNIPFKKVLKKKEKNFRSIRLSQKWTSKKEEVNYGLQLELLCLLLV